MGWRFNKRIRLGKGVYWNVGKRGSSLSFGGHGTTVNISKKGVRKTFRIPGTGLSYTTTTSQGGGCGCSLVLGIILTGFFATSHKTVKTTEATTEVQYFPSATPEPTPTPEPGATAALPEMRRAVPVFSAPTPDSQAELNDAEGDLNRAWKSLTVEQRGRLQRDEARWVKYKDTLPLGDRIKKTQERAKYLWSLVERTFDD